MGYAAGCGQSCHPKMITDRHGTPNENAAARDEDLVKNEIKLEPAASRYLSRQYEMRMFGKVMQSKRTQGILSCEQARNPTDGSDKTRMPSYASRLH